MKRTIAVFLCIVLWMLLPSCQQRRDIKIWKGWDNIEGWDQKGYFSFCGLECGITEEEIVKYLGLRVWDYEKTEPENREDSFISLVIENEEPIFGVL